jgi:flagellar M-ring protein FliF
MAAEDITLINPEPVRFYQTPFGRNIMLGAGIAAVLGLMVAIWLWTQKQDDVVLFSNVSDRDGGAIIASLQQMNVPYKHADGGGAILVPADKVHDARLRLAAQGLPKGGNVGFELMENQKLGVSQFLEQVNYQRAVEGNLAQHDPVDLGRRSRRACTWRCRNRQVFVRDQQKPTASVLLTLHPGRALDRGQVQAIVHLVASSISELTPANVTVLDQNGTLLSDTDKANKQLDPNQLKYTEQMQQSIVRKVESLVAPIVGERNVRAEATADIDFAQTEQAAESYRPNSAAGAAAIRSDADVRSGQRPAGPASGVPGALSNQPPAPNTAPVQADGTLRPPRTMNGSSRRDATTNYEVDKTVRYSQQGMGGVKRLTVGVVVNYKRSVNAKTGKVTITPLTEAEKAQIDRLVKAGHGLQSRRAATPSTSRTSRSRASTNPIRCRKRRHGGRTRTTGTWASGSPSS